MSKSVPKSDIKQMIMIVKIINVTQPMNCLEFMHDWYEI